MAHFSLHTISCGWRSFISTTDRMKSICELNACNERLLSDQVNHEVFPITFLSHYLRKDKTMLTKNQVIDAICRLNPTAPIDWLSSFDLTALRRYYEHLLITLEPRGTRGWVRMAGTPAAITRRPAA